MENTKNKLLHVRGINKQATYESILDHFSTIGEVVNLKFETNPRKGYCWVEFANQKDADEAVRTLHHSRLHGTYLSVNYEVLADPLTGKRVRIEPNTSLVVPKSSKTRDISQTQAKSDGKQKKRSSDSVFYASNGLFVNEIYYPTSQGLYQTKLLRRAISIFQTPSEIHFLPLLSLLMHPQGSCSKQSKEITESLSMVNAVLTLVGLEKIQPSRPVQCFIVADGVTPFTAAALALFLPSHWRFVSIDPLLSYDMSSLHPDLRERFRAAPCMTQDFDFSWVFDVSSSQDHSPEGEGEGEDMGSVCIIVAPHSHAPLAQFWEAIPRRHSPSSFPSPSSPPILCLPSPIISPSTLPPLSPPSLLLAVTLPCCGKSQNWSSLPLPPLRSYSDFEVLSPKREVHLYSSNQKCTEIVSPSTTDSSLQSTPQLASDHMMDSSPQMAPSYLNPEFIEE